MTVWIQYASLICVAAGLAGGLLAVVVTRDGRVALQVALDLWLAAGLLRLALPASVTQLLAAAAIVVVRQVVGRALRTPADQRPARSAEGTDRPG